MTKKYWNDWQRRVGETKNIYKFWFYGDGTVRRLSHCGILSEFSGDSLLSVKFRGDAVDLVIERKRETFDYRTHSWHQHVQNDYLTLHRKDIGKIEFIKY